MKDLIKAHIQRSIDVKKKLIEDESIINQIVKAGEVISNAFNTKNKLLCCGNGGSAGDAQHIATEFIIRYTGSHNRPSLPALSLSTDTSAITAAGNDFGFDFIFSRQLEGIAREADVLLAITTSGNSKNILEALKTARKINMKTILLTGGDGGVIMQNNSNLVDHVICVPNIETARIQECHIMIGQILCAIVEKKLYNLG